MNVDPIAFLTIMPFVVALMFNYGMILMELSFKHSCTIKTKKQLWTYLLIPYLFIVVIFIECTQTSFSAIKENIKKLTKCAIPPSPAASIPVTPR